MNETLTPDLIGRETSPAVRSAVGSNPGTPPGTLALLAQDPDSNVQIAVGSNPNTPPDTLVNMVRTDTKPSSQVYHQNRRAALEKIFVEDGHFDRLPPCRFCESHCVEDRRYYDPLSVDSLLQSTDDLIRRVDSTINTEALRST